MSSTFHPGQEGQSANAWLGRFFDTIDSKDAQAVVEYFTDDGRFIYADSTPVRGKRAIRDLRTQGWAKFFFPGRGAAMRK